MSHDLNTLLLSVLLKSTVRQVVSTSYAEKQLVVMSACNREGFLCSLTPTWTLLCKQRQNDPSTTSWSTPRRRRSS